MPLKIRCTGKCHLTMKVKVWDITEGLPKGQSCVLKVKSDIVKENRWRKEMSAFVGTSLSNVDFGGHLHAATEALLIYSKPRILLLWILRFFFFSSILEKWEKRPLFTQGSEPAPDSSPCNCVYLWLCISVSAGVHFVQHYWLLCMQWLQTTRVHFGLPCSGVNNDHCRALHSCHVVAVAINSRT